MIITRLTIIFLKLDILGHDDPTMIRMLQDLTGVDPTQIPLDDKAVMSLFQDTSALGITPDDLANCQLGALGIPEFGTDFAMGMLIDTQPKRIFGSGAYCRAVPWYGRMAWQCTDTDSGKEGNDFYRHLYKG